MFTGIVEHRGRVTRIAKRSGGARLEIAAPQIVSELSPGDSVAVNGACVTVTERNAQSFACDLVPETVARTTLGILQIDEEVNLERPMRMSDRFGGHLVQGHIDAVGVVRSRRRVGAQEVLEITIPFELSRFLAPQGSVALDGVSLTVVAVDRDRFRVALIPYTVEMTTLGQKVQGSSLNVEIDVLSKYVERHLLTRMTKPNYLTPVPPPQAPVEEPHAAPPPKPRRPVPPRTPAPRRSAAPARAKSRTKAKKGTRSRTKTARTRTPSRTTARKRAPAPAKKTASKTVKKKPARSVARTRTGAKRSARRR